MKKFFRNPILNVLAASMVLGLIGPITAFAATSPVLTGAASYSVLGFTTVTNTGATTTAGDVGVSTGTAITNFPPGLAGGDNLTHLHSNDASAILARADNISAYGILDQGCGIDYTGAGTKNLTLLSPLGPGVYCADAFTLTGNLTLTGTSGVWIFKSASTIITSSGSSVTGGDPCNTWWRAVSSVTLGTTTSFEGNILALTSVGLDTGATLNGRAMAQTGAVTLDTNTITGPVCAAAPLASSSSTGTITVVKNVINDNGGTKIVSDFPLFINGNSVTSGVPNSLSGDSTYTIYETSDPKYAATFSGDCDSTGHINLSPSSNKFCIITNNDIGPALVVPPVPPIIDVVKVPSPLALPGGPGPVTYTYTLRNIGTVPVTNITMIGDSCSPINLFAGDVNSDSKLDLNETWTYRCSTTLSATHTNTVVATGWANGISATDIASATVIVGSPLVPPLIHVTKVPNPLTLPVGGGMVTYTEKITNPGTVALSNVKLTDDKCSPVNYISGDVNGDSKLDTTETWTYTCQTKLTATTTNTATAIGEANGMTVRDFAIATVVVAAPLHAAPGLPKTGVAPMENGTPWAIVIMAGILMSVVALKKGKI